MATPSKPSRWGTFLSQAVAGVEARLDNILAEEDPAAKPPPGSSSSKPAAPSAKSANDRLQERLARAVAVKNAGGTASPTVSASSARGSAEISRSPRPSAELTIADASLTALARSPRTDLSKEEGLERESAPGAVTGTEIEKTNKQQHPASPTTNGERMSVEASRSSMHDERPYTSESPPDIAPPTNDDTVSVTVATSEKIVSSLDLYEKRVTELENSMTEVQSQHQEELHTYVEQIDALQAKLQYLAREAAESAQRDASAARPVSLEKKLAEKDQQIAQLMGEGTKLAGNEQKLRAAVKKLRAQIATNEKEINEQKIWRQDAEAELNKLRETARTLKGYSKTNDEAQKNVSRLKRDLERAKSAAASKDMMISDLKAQVQEESERAKVMAAKANDQLREAGQQKVRDLEDTIAALQVEKSLSADRAKAQANDLREKAERATERSRATELELKGEVQILESKLEALRATAEEVSSGAVGDAQAKLLRQIETLQTQHSVASENWQGMETSLLARAANLERERDEALRRESEMRKKARESTARVKRQEEELEEAKTKLPTFQRDLSDHQNQIDSIRRRAEAAETALAEATAELEKQQATTREELAEKASYERRPWLDETALRDNSLPASPSLNPPQRAYSNDYLGLQNFSAKFRKTSAPSSNGGDSPGERPVSARKPSQQSRPSIFSMPSAQSGTTSLLGGAVLESIASPTHPLERDEVFDLAETPASPQNVLQDMVSVSTIAAGPSVQLVERMSAAIRRLESDKVAAKEELARISSQRDEARAEIVALMKEVELSKSTGLKVEDLQKEVLEINERYQTTLEMLGEKSELVEELRADVQDVKDMYKDLVERTHR